MASRFNVGASEVDEGCDRSFIRCMCYEMSQRVQLVNKRIEVTIEMQMKKLIGRQEQQNSKIV